MRALLAIVLLSSLVAPARADDLGVVAVLPMAMSSMRADAPAPNLETLTEAIRTATADALSPLGYTVLTGENTLRVLQDNGIDPSKACEASCAMDVARELKARLFVAGTVSNAEGDLLAFVRLFDGQTGRQLGSVQLEGVTVKEIRRQFTDKAGAFYQGAIGRLKASGVVQVEDETGTVPLRVETPLEADAFTVEVLAASGTRKCAKELTFLQPCLLRLPAGPVRVAATGPRAISASFQTAPNGNRIVIDRTELPASWGWGLGLTIAGSLATLVFVEVGAILASSSDNGGPEFFRFGSTPSNVGIGLGVPALIGGILLLTLPDNLPAMSVENL